MSGRVRLGVNIDHVATVRNARGGAHPDPVRAARLAADAGADGITAHLREDRRHISDADIERLTRDIDRPLNLEMAAIDEMLAIALRHKPHAACIVPEKRQELTTEGGLDPESPGLPGAIDRLLGAGIDVSLFIDPEENTVRRSKELGASTVELHTGDYCEADGDERALELVRLHRAAAVAEECDLKVAAGHGLDYPNVVPVAAIAAVEELNIGHAIMSRALFVGLDRAVRDMLALINGG